MILELFPLLDQIFCVIVSRLLESIIENTVEKLDLSDGTFKNIFCGHIRLLVKFYKLEIWLILFKSFVELFSVILLNMNVIEEGKFQRSLYFL